MAPATSFGGAGDFYIFVQSHFVTLCVFLAVSLGLLARNFNHRSNLPHANPPNTFGFKITKQLEFTKNGMDLIHSSRNHFFGKAYRLLTTLGEVVVLPAQYGGVIHNEPKLNFRKAAKAVRHLKSVYFVFAGSADDIKDLQGHIAGFQPFALIDHPSELMQNLVKKHLTKFLNTVTAPLSSEASLAIDRIYGSAPDWQTVSLQKSVSAMVAQLSSRVFLGEELCRNEEWLTITSTYTLEAFAATMKMSLIPGFIKPIWCYFSSDCRKVRRHMERAREIIWPVINKRRALKEQARRNKEPMPYFNDAIEWAEAEHHGKFYDPASCQLFLSFAAIHTTTDLLCQVMLCLANEPALISPLREEMIQVLRTEGWKKTALYNMKLLDSAIKEAQRIRPSGKLQLRRIAIEDVTLEGDVKIYKGQRVQVDMAPMWDPSTYPNPHTYDMYRFLRMREQPGGANKAQLVTTSPDFLPFGHGKYACPGRFFAGNEIKIALCHLLLKYDWELAPGTTTEPLIFGQFMSNNPNGQLRYRRRKEEIDLEALGFD